MSKNKKARHLKKDAQKAAARDAAQAEARKKQGISIQDIVNAAGAVKNDASLKDPCSNAIAAAAEPVMTELKTAAMKAMRKPFVGPLERGDVSRKIEFHGKASNLPLIAGSNYFSGEFDSKDLSLGLLVDDQAQWNDIWRTLGKTPPGPLPEKARAVIEYVRRNIADLSVAVAPDRIEIKDNNDIEIDWALIHVTKDEDKDAQSRFAVLLLPEKGKLKSNFNKVWPIREKRQRRDKYLESLDDIKKGPGQPLQAPARATFKRKHHLVGRTRGKNGY